jgi:hypothetical protein
MNVHIQYPCGKEAGADIETGYRSSSPGRVKNFLHIVQSSSEAHPAFYTVGTGGSFSGGKVTGP